MTRRFAIVGHPVAHSLSPRIHLMFGQASGIDLCYERLLAPLDDFSGAASRFFAAGGSGLNVTLPFKEQAFAWVDATDRHAEHARAVNTIGVERGRHVGFNTDGLGLLSDLVDGNGFRPRGSRILILGAGGAVRGVLGPLLDAGPDEIVVANRTHERALRLVAELADPRLLAVAMDAVGGQFDLVINGTSASLLGRVPVVPAAIVYGSLCYDMAYGAAPTAFCRWALDHEADKAVDGLGMLIEQAAIAFRLWHGVLPATSEVRNRLREELRAASG
jgi:shikimate dehydrogenase